MYGEILVPTDGSAEAARAAAEAVELARLTDGRLHGLYVVDTRSYGALSESKWLTLEESLEQEGEEAMETLRVSSDTADVPLVTSVERGVPHRRIQAYAEEHGIDAIVMGTHGRTGLDHFLLGSVTEKVIRRANVPVLVVRGDGSE